MGGTLISMVTGGGALVRRTRLGLAGAAFLLTGGVVAACDLCSPQGPPFSFEIAQAKAVVFGVVTSARLAADGRGGTSELRIDAVLKGQDQLKGRQTLTLPRYVPPDQKVHFLLFLDVVKGQFDPYRGLPFPSNRVVKYLAEAPAVDAQAKAEVRAERLLYYFQFLNDPEPEIAADAFKEWASATNQEVGLVAGRLSADKLRAWLLDRKTQPARLSLYAYLLGACGNDRDAELLRRMVQNPDERSGTAIDGLLAGYIRLRPAEGWHLAEAVAGDAKRPFTQRHAVLRMLRFAYGYQPNETRDHLLRCVGLMLRQDDLLDLAVDHLRQWKLWNLTGEVLRLYGQPAADAPITKRAIVRYALSCPLPEARKFVAELRQREPELVADVQESLQLESQGRP
jgi:hypothetical protein